MVLTWAPVSVAILACLANLAVFHSGDNTGIVIAVVIAAALGWSQALTVRDLRDHASRLAAREAMFRRLAHTDPLTGLANRRALDHMLARQTHPDSNSVVLFIDLDGFKAINDALGHDAGDRVLQRLADRIRANLGSDDFAARFGGDEFVLVLGVCPERAVAAAHRWFAVICAPYLVGGAPVPLSASIGFARCGEFADAGSLIRCADLALRRAKSNGKGRIEVYETVALPTPRTGCTEGAGGLLDPGTMAAGPPSVHAAPAAHQRA